MQIQEPKGSEDLYCHYQEFPSIAIIRRFFEATVEAFIEYFGQEKAPAEFAKIGYKAKKIFAKIGIMENPGYKYL